MKTKLHIRFFLVLLAGLSLIAVAAPGLLTGSVDPVAVKARIDAWSGWARVGLAVALLAYLAAMLDTFGRLFAAVAIRSWNAGVNSSRKAVLLRFSSLVALVGGVTLWRILAPGMFPHPSNAWMEPCLLGVALVPVAVAGAALLSTRKSQPVKTGNSGNCPPDM